MLEKTIQSTAIFCIDYIQFDESLSKRIKTRIFYEKTVDVGRSDLHNTRHLLRGEMKAT